jgi:hypothetical protein
VSYRSGDTVNDDVGGARGPCDPVVGGFGVVGAGILPRRSPRRVSEVGGWEFVVGSEKDRRHG